MSRYRPRDKQLLEVGIYLLVQRWAINIYAE